MDNATPQVSDDDFLGQIECTLGEVCCSACKLAVVLFVAHLVKPVLKGCVYIYVLNFRFTLTIIVTLLLLNFVVCHKGR